MSNLILYQTKVTKTIRYYFALIKFLKIKKNDNIQCFKGTRKWSLVLSVDGSENYLSGEQYAGF